MACLLIADDLTGACDAAVHFAARGDGAAVCLARGADGLALWRAGAGAFAISTETRGLGEEEIRAVYAELGELRRSLPDAALLFKKIDSTLRGSVGVEISLAAAALACDCAIVTPAFPGQGRKVEGGTLRVAGANPGAVELPGYWREQGLCECLHVAPRGLAAALASGARFISVDAAIDGDLDRIAEAGLRFAGRVLWAGSAGLAAALARAAPRGPAEAPHAPQDYRLYPAESAAGWPVPALSGVLLCIGSHHAVTIEQRSELLAARAVVELSAVTASPASLAQALHAGRHVLLEVPYGCVSEEGLRRLIGDWTGALVLSGGSTASLVCRAIGAREIRLHRELAAGIPRGVICGGSFHGAPVVTKSGGFGAPSALIQILDDLICP